jgi:hypothetical protein
MDGLLESSFNSLYACQREERNVYMDFSTHDPFVDLMSGNDAELFLCQAGAGCLMSRLYQNGVVDRWYVRKQYVPNEMDDVSLVRSEVRKVWQEIFAIPPGYIHSGSRVVR